jgi:dihydrofolate reductase
MPRKVILGFGISLDGYIARRNGDLDFLVIDKEGEALMADFFSKIDTTIMGRKTAEAAAKLCESGEMPETPGMANYVVSRRWKPGKREGFEVVGGSLAAFVKKLKSRPGKDIYLGGGGELCRSFLQKDLVDELYIGVAPILLGDGIPGFPGKFPQRDFGSPEGAKMLLCTAFRKPCCEQCCIWLISKTGICGIQSLARILAASPIQTSCPAAAAISTNHWQFPVDSIPIRAAPGNPR